ncbi:DUF5327 family protein [Bacillus carboniphilus]|uniref:DUF5327 family protein n=1 Tax=Bacillus carboniphilus TaxID=86663 RepID=A0ABY9JQT6_9BACI|nr:DUF5327 family protein [Bacillus carboniphilus]WLR41764.1 DUF5327 family protein [Bacillus carboniphilus]
MNISVSSILNEMEKELTKARQSEKDIQSHIMTIRSLCNVILENSQSEQVHTSSEQQLAKMMGAKPKETVTPSENSSNDSIFDF